MGLTDWITIGQMDDLGRMDTPVHRLDARAKIIVTFVYIAVVMSFPRYEISALTPFVVYPIVLISLGRIPVQQILRKLLVASPFALVIGIFNPLIDHQPVASIGSFVITGGWCSFASILLRFILTVSAALVLVACTGMYPLGVGLKQLGIPRVFVVQLLFFYRYLFVVVDEGIKMLRSFKLRSFRTGSLSPHVYGSLVGHLLLRSIDRAERVYRSMIARGFEGEVHLLNPSKLRWTDALFVCGSLAFFLIARRWDLAEEMGIFLTGAAL